MGMKNVDKNIDKRNTHPNAMKIKPPRTLLVVLIEVSYLRFFMRLLPRAERAPFWLATRPEESTRTFRVAWKSFWPWTDDGLVDAITSMTFLSLKVTRLGPMSSMAANATVAKKQKGALWRRRPTLASKKVALSGLG